MLEVTGASTSATTSAFTLGSGATLRLAQGGTLGVASGGSLYVTGGTLEFGTGGGTVTLGGGGAQLNHTQGQLSLANGSITGEGELIVGSAGLNLGATGSEGSLVGTSAAGRITIWGNVSGTGSMTHVTVYGDLSVGNSPGTLTADDVTLSGSSTLTMELGGLAAGTQYDQIVVDGALTLDGTLGVVWYDGFEASVGDSFTLLRPNGGALTGTFDTMNLAAFSNAGLEWDTSALYSAGTITAVPEPATMSLLTMGVLALIRRRRK